MKRKIVVMRKDKVVDRVERVIVFLIRAGWKGNYATVQYRGQKYYVVERATFRPLTSTSDRHLFDDACILLG